MLNRGSELGQRGVVALGGKLGEASDCPGLGDQQLVSERVGDRSRLLGEIPSVLEVAPVCLERGDRGQDKASSSGGLELDRAPIVTSRISNPEKGLVHAKRRESGCRRVEVSSGLGDPQRFRRAVDGRVPFGTEVPEGREPQENVHLAAVVARSLAQSLLRVRDRLSHRLRVVLVGQALQSVSAKQTVTNRSPDVLAECGGASSVSVLEPCIRGGDATAGAFVRLILRGQPQRVLEEACRGEWRAATARVITSRLEPKRDRLVGNKRDEREVVRALLDVRNDVDQTPLPTSAVGGGHLRVHD